MKIKKLEKNTYMMGLVGIVSGLLSFAVLQTMEELSFSGDLLPYSPGPIFAIAISIYLFVTNRKEFHLGKHFLWWVGSSIAYYVAVNTAISLFDVLSLGQNPSYFAMFVAGTVGALIVGISFNYLISKIGLIWIIFLSIIGGVLGLSFFINSDLPSLPLYTIWQAGIAFSLGMVTQKKKININPSILIVSVVILLLLMRVGAYLIDKEEDNNVSKPVKVTEHQEDIKQANDEIEPINSIAPNSVVVYPLEDGTWERGGNFRVGWNIPGASYPVYVKAIGKDYGEINPSNCQVFFDSDEVDPSLGNYFLNIPNDACPGRYKVQVCKYESIFEYSKCYENEGYVRVAGGPELACSYPNATTDWGDGLYNCPAGEGKDQNRCYNGVCKPCDGLLAYDQKAGKYGCWYLANPGLSCAEFCGAKGSMDGKWGDEASCSIGKALTGCTTCSTEYDNGWLVPYYDIPKNMCVRNLGAGTYYNDRTKSEYTNIQRMCSCNY